MDKLKVDRAFEKPSEDAMSFRAELGMDQHVDDNAPCLGKSVEAESTVVMQTGAAPTSESMSVNPESPPPKLRQGRPSFKRVAHEDEFQEVNSKSFSGFELSRGPVEL